MAKFVFISDTHSKHHEITIPECDFLFHTGDWTGLGNKHDVEDFAKWLSKQPARNIVVIPGNHEKTFSKCLNGTKKDPSSRTWITDHCRRAHVLIHESVEIEGIKIFGSPYTPYFYNWAWNAGRTTEESARYQKPFIGHLWKDIPVDTEILLTHGPAHGILDYVVDWYDSKNILSVGCEELLKRINELNDLKIHAFGHLHKSGGMTKDINGVKYINAAVCNDDYRTTNKIVEIEVFPELNWSYK